MADVKELWGVKCWQPAKVGQLRTREIICYEEALVSSLRVLL